MNLLIWQLHYVICECVMASLSSGSLVNNYFSIKAMLGGNWLSLRARCCSPKTLSLMDIPHLGLGLLS